jgi:enterochelin esterase-like enzyme
MMNDEGMVVQEKAYALLEVEQRIVYSEYLERDVVVDLYIPDKKDLRAEMPLLLVNDGQDLVTMDFAAILDSLFCSGHIPPLVCVGIHCGADRLNEYGTACRPDYKGRGAKAGLYNKFILDELLPFLRKELNVSDFTEKSFAGFSLGGLSAIDIVWNHANQFTKVGVFSGALWWRRKGYEDNGYHSDKDRIMHLQVQKGSCSPWLQFFFQCGQLDETADRNNNGIIDSIEDAGDLIEDLRALGYKDEQIRYLELEDGGHNVETWARAFPEFLRWGWGSKTKG